MSALVHPYGTKIAAESETVIGYSVYEKFEECYQYNENECYIDATIPQAEHFMAGGFTDAADCGIDTIRFADIMSDYGASLGNYAMEAEAFSGSRQSRIAAVCHSMLSHMTAMNR